MFFFSADADFVVGWFVKPDYDLFHLCFLFHRGGSHLSIVFTLITDKSNDILKAFSAIDLQSIR